MFTSGKSTFPKSHKTILGASNNPGSETRNGNCVYFLRPCQASPEIYPCTIQLYETINTFFFSSYTLVFNFHFKSLATKMILTKQNGQTCKIQFRKIK